MYYYCYLLVLLLHSRTLNDRLQKQYRSRKFYEDLRSHICLDESEVLLLNGATRWTYSTGLQVASKT